MPRSGTTWLSQIFSASRDVRLKSCPLFSYEFKNLLDEDSTTSDWQNLFSAVYRTNSEFLNQEHLRRYGLIPSRNEECFGRRLFIKSNRFHHLTPNMLLLNKNVRFVYLVRDPRASIYSWISDPHEFPDNADPLSEWKTGCCRKTNNGEFWGFDDWVNVTAQAVKLSDVFPQQHKIIRYEELVRNPNEVINALCEFFRLPFSDEMKSFIELSHSRHDSHKHSVFKDPTKINNWRLLLDGSIANECERSVKGTPLEIFLDK